MKPLRKASSPKLSIIDENLTPESEDRKSEADVLEIFVRINREGTPLNRSDLIFSMLKLTWKESAEALPDFVHGVNEGNSLALETDFVIRCLFAVSDLGAKFELDHLRNKSNVQKLQDNFDGCCNAIKATVDFLTQHCSIQNSGLLGGRTILVPFVYYFFHTKKHRVSRLRKFRALAKRFTGSDSRAPCRAMAIVGQAPLSGMPKPLAKKVTSRFLSKR